MQNKAKRKIDYKRVLWCLAMMVLGTMMFMAPVFAAVGSSTASDVMANLIGLMCSMFRYVGTAIFVWAIIQFVLATKRSDADSKADAVQTAVCGIALMAIGVIVGAMGLDGNLTSKADDYDIGEGGGSGGGGGGDALPD